MVEAVEIGVVVIFFSYAMVTTFRLFETVVGRRNPWPSICFGAALVVALLRRIFVIMFLSEGDAWMGVLNNVVAPVAVGSLFLVGVHWFHRRVGETANQITAMNVLREDQEHKALAEKLQVVADRLKHLTEEK